jgi:hypothetical protein
VFSFVLNVAVVNNLIPYDQASGPACVSHRKMKLQYTVKLMKQLQDDKERP